MGEDETLDFEGQLDELLNLDVANLSEEQQSLLSQVLFPDTHTNKVVFAGSERELRPMTVKWSRKVHATLKPFNQKAAAAAQSEELYSLDDDLTEALYGMARHLSEYYQWEDVPAKIDEEDILLEDLQRLAVEQQFLQGENDFLLAPLRAAIKLMQTREILLVKMKTGSQRSSSTTQPSVSG